MTTIMRPLDDAVLFAFFRAIALGDPSALSWMLETSGDQIAVLPIRIASSRQDSTSYFLDAIGHHVYAGDTALHIAAAAYRRDLAPMLVDKGAMVRARNRRGAEPLHYAADGNPDAPRWDPNAQRDVITYLVANGADPNAVDRSGVAPLHRAVRTRCSAAVEALLDGGVDPKMPNKTDSTPLHLAVQNTGRGHSGAAAAREQQAAIVKMLLQHGARPSDTDANGKTVEAAATSAWVRELLT
jgi:ankyrin repeat protein